MKLSIITFSFVQVFSFIRVTFGYTGGQYRSLCFAERMAERLSSIDGVDIEINHTAKQCWAINHARENCDIIFQEELR